MAMNHTLLAIVRPEYVEAVEAATFTARLNIWLAPLLLIAPLLLFTPMLRRWHWSAIGGLFLVTLGATWFCYYRWSDTSWRTIEAIAVTDEELALAAADTDAVFEPIFLGTGFAVFYPAMWCGMASMLRQWRKRFRRPEIRTGPPIPNH